MVLLYGVNSALSLSNARTLVDNQMAVHAADAATALSVAISQGQATEDAPLLEVLFNALSDGGYYQRVELVDVEGRTLIRREFPVAGPQVPAWFVDWMALPERIGRADVTTGWTRFGEVIVVSHPGQAYQQLWQLAGRQAGWFALATLLFSLLGAMALRRLLVPLRLVVAQADAIRERRFRVQEKLPRAPELRTLVVAMNRMAARLGELFSRQAELIADLRRVAAVDMVTGLGNRTDFDARLQALLEESGEHRNGMVAILALADLALVNERWGRSEGNALLRSIGEQLREILAPYPQSLLARRQGAEFAVFVPDLDPDEAASLAAVLQQSAEAAPFAHRVQHPLRVRLGYRQGAMRGGRSELLEEAGFALRQVPLAATPAVRCYQPATDGGIPLVSRSGVDWAGTIARLLAQRALSLVYQPTVSVPERAVIGGELYTRASPEVIGAAVAPGALLPMVERAGQAAAYDRLALELLAAAPSIGLPWYAYNLSPQSLCASEFLDWLDEFLGVHHALANRLVFELPEFVATARLKALRDFQRLIAPHGAAIGLDHFGIETSGFAYLGSLPLAHVKVHRSITATLDQDRDSQFYIKALAQLTHTREIPLIVEGVEREEQWRILLDAHIDAAQGFLLGEPQPVGAEPGL